jgi:homogentisate 1,2-dioxygenase
VPDDHVDPAGDPMLLYSNAEVRISLSRRSAPMPFFTGFLDGDVVLFTHQGTGTVETEFGPITYRPGDWMYLPKASLYRVVPDGADTHQLVIETRNELRIPPISVLGRHHPYDSTMVFVPEPLAYDGDGRDEYEVRYTLWGGEHTSHFYPTHPLDAVGWRGDNFPFRLNIDEYDVLTSDSVHLPPSVHVFLQNHDAWLLHFLPHRAEAMPGTERSPWYHRNCDFDEIAFYHGGTVFGVTMPSGLFSHAPQGIQHGVSERVRERARRMHDEVERVEWEIIAIDTRARLEPSPAVLAHEAAVAAAEAARDAEPART